MKSIKFRKLIIFAYAIFLGTIRYSLAEVPPTQLQKEPATVLVGGWYPIFFDTYDQTKVDSIVGTIKQNRAKRIVVTYDKNTNLANKIIAGIQSTANFAVERSQVELKDGSATFDYNRVSVIVYLKANKSKEAK